MVKELKTIKLNEIIPSEYNPRRISQDEFTKLKNSLDKFGLVDPIIINLKNNKIVGGHQRYEVLFKENPYGEVYVVDLGDIGWVITDTDLDIKDEAHEKALNLALNKIRGEFDIQKLNVLIDELAELNLAEISGFDLGLNEVDYEFEERTRKKYEFINYNERDEIEEFNNTKRNVEEEEIKLIQNIESEESHFVEKKQVYKIKNSLIFCGSYTEKERDYCINNAFKELRLSGDDVHLVKMLNTSVDCFYSKKMEQIEQILKNYEYPMEILRVR